MSAGYLELFVEQGEDFSISVTLDSLNGSPYSLANTSVKSQIRKSHWSQDVSATFNSVVLNNAQGILELSLPANTTQDLRPGRYVYDVFLTANTGVSNTRSKVLEGIVSIEPSSTKI